MCAGYIVFWTCSRLFLCRCLPSLCWSVWRCYSICCLYISACLIVWVSLSVWSVVLSVSDCLSLPLSVCLPIFPFAVSVSLCISICLTVSLCVPASTSVFAYHSLSWLWSVNISLATYKKCLTISVLNLCSAHYLSMSHINPCLFSTRRFNPSL